MTRLLLAGCALPILAGCAVLANGPWDVQVIEARWSPDRRQIAFATDSDLQQLAREGSFTLQADLETCVTGGQDPGPGVPLADILWQGRSVNDPTAPSPAEGPNTTTAKSQHLYTAELGTYTPLPPQPICLLLRGRNPVGGHFRSNAAPLGREEKRQGEPAGSP